MFFSGFLFYLTIRLRENDVISDLQIIRAYNVRKQHLMIFTYTLQYHIQKSIFYYYRSSVTSFPSYKIRFITEVSGCIYEEGCARVRTPGFRRTSAGNKLAVKWSLSCGNWNFLSDRTLLQGEGSVYTTHTHIFSDVGKMRQV